MKCLDSRFVNSVLMGDEPATDLYEAFNPGTLHDQKTTWKAIFSFGTDYEVWKIGKKLLKNLIVQEKKYRKSWKDVLRQVKFVNKQLFNILLFYCIAHGIFSVCKFYCKTNF